MIFRHAATYGLLNSHCIAIAALSVLIGTWAPAAVAASDADRSGPVVGAPKVFATGFNNPRGLKFGPDGDLYVAEGGTGGPLATTAADCDQVIPEIGPYTGSPVGARISGVDRHGIRTTVIDNLPSSQTSAASGSLISGVADVAFIEDTLYAVLAGAGCSHGIAGIPNGVIRVGHAVRSLDVADAPGRRYELAEGLAYLAATYQ